VWPFEALALMLYSCGKQTRIAMLTLILTLSGLFVDAQSATPYSASSNSTVKLVTESPINLGEKLEFKLSYGWFTVGRAVWYTDHNYQTMNGEKCIKFKVTARSAGLAGIFATVEDEWGEYMRPSDFLPVLAYRDLKEGKYIIDEKTYFDYSQKKIRTEVVKRGNPKPTEYFNMEKNRLAMLGAFMQMRCIDYAKYKPGDRIRIEAFFEGEPYELDVIYKGKEELRSKVGRLQAYKLVPLMPENRLFPGKEPIAVWISADKNRLPLRADANMYFGSAYVELTNYKNIKFGPDYQ
jgi:hypothetical protein